MWKPSHAHVLSTIGLLALAGGHSVNAQRFRSGVDLVALAVTVTDGEGRAVTGLGVSDFNVFDHGQLQEVTLFASAQVPIDVMLLIDTSSSMGDALPAVKTGARGLLRTMRSGDRAGLVEVKGTITVPAPLTADLASVEAAVDQMSARGDTALHNGIYVSLRQFERERRLQPELRRQALVLFSDGVDTASAMGFDEVTALAHALDVTIYSITLQDANPPDDPRRAATWQMRTLTRDSGGLSYFAKQVRELKRIYETIARELVNQYALAYVAPAAAEGQTFRRVSIGLVPPVRGIARTRSGYVVVPVRARAPSGASQR